MRLRSNQIWISFVLFVFLADATNELHSFYPEACVLNPNKLVYKTIDPTHYCSFLSLEPKGRKFTAKSCNHQYETIGNSHHSYGQSEFYQFGDLTIAPFCPNPTGPNTVLNRTATGWDYGYWHCLDSSTFDQTEDCQLCGFGQNLTGCYGGDTLFRSIMRPDWPCSMSPSENVTCASEISKCTCYWRCYKKFDILMNAENFVEASNNNDEIALLFGATSSVFEEMDDRCEDVQWQYLGARKTENDAVESFIKFENRALTITVNPAGDYSVIIWKDDLREFKTFSGTFFSYALSNNFRLTSGTLHVELYSAGEKIDFGDFEILGISVCDSRDCVNCMEFIQDLKCMQPTVRYLFIALAVLAVLFFICIFPCVQTLLKLIFSWVFLLAKKLLKAIYNFGKNSRLTRAIGDQYSTLKEEMEERQPQNTRQEAAFVTNPEAPNLRDRLRQARMNRLAFFFLFFAVSLPAVRACDNGLLVPVSLSECITNGATETCSGSFEVVVGLPFIGAKSCISLSDAKSNVYYGTVNITLDSILHTNTLDLQYYTSERTQIVQSHRYCYDLVGGFCHSPLFSDFDPCTEVNQYPFNYVNNIRGTDIFKDDRISNNPTKTTCRRVPGGLTNNCGAINQGCVVSRYGIVPVKDPWAVYKAGSELSSIASIKIAFDHSGIDDAFECKGTGNSCTGKGNLTAYIDVVTPGQQLNLQGLCVMKGSDSRVPSGVCNPRNTLTAGEIGELQAATGNSFIGGSFSWSTDIITMQENGNEDMFNIIPNPFLRTPTVVLPGFIESNYVTEQAGKIYTNGSGSVQLRIKTNTPMKITRKTSLVCPKITFISATGCSQCTSGVTLTLSGKSTCAEGNVLVRDDVDEIKLYTNDVSLGLIDREFNIKLYTDSVENKVTLSFVNGAQKQDLIVTFSAPVNISINNGSYIVERGTISEDPSNENPWAFSWGDFFERSLLGRGTTLEIIVTCVIFVAVGLILVILIYIIFKKKMSYKFLYKFADGMKKVN